MPAYEGTEGGDGEGIKNRQNLDYVVYVEPHGTGGRSILPSCKVGMLCSTHIPSIKESIYDNVGVIFTYNKTTCMSIHIAYEITFFLYAWV